MTHWLEGTDRDELAVQPTTSTLAIYAQAAAFYTTCLKAGYHDEATEFAEWFLETFDLDLET